MASQFDPAEFSLQGGPFHRLGTSLGLVRGRNTLRLGVATGAFLWIVLVALAIVSGVAAEVFSLSRIGGHVRLLFVIPFFFFAESLVDPRQTTLVELLFRSGVVSGDARVRFERDLTRIMRWSNSWALELLCAAIAIGFSFFAGQFIGGSTAAFDASRLGEMGLAGWWYFFVCLPIFRFLLLRIFMRVVLWAYFIWRLSLLDLKLIATHPDAAAGLGYLEVVLSHFHPLFTAISALQAASLAEDMVKGEATIDAMLPTIAVVLLINAVLFVAPLLLVLRKLWRCQVKALDEYMNLASTYVVGFDRKWLRWQTPPEESFLGTSDLQSLADLNNSMLVVRKMRLIPISIPIVLGLVWASVAPMLPLLLFEYPIADIATKFLTRLTGL